MTGSSRYGEVACTFEYGFLQHENSIFVKTLFSLNRKLRKQSAKDLLTVDGVFPLFAPTPALQKNEKVRGVVGAIK